MSVGVGAPEGRTVLIICIKYAESAYEELNKIARRHIKLLLLL